MKYPEFAVAETKCVHCGEHIMWSGVLNRYVHFVTESRKCRNGGGTEAELRFVNPRKAGR